MNNQKYDNLRNRLGQTAIPNVEGLKPVRMTNPRDTSIANRLNRVTVNDNLEARMAKLVSDRKQSIRKAKATGLIDKGQMFTNFGLNQNGQWEEELI